MAQNLMYGGAVVGVLSIISSFFTMDELREQVSNSSPEISPADLDSAVIFSLAISTVIGLVYVGLWLWMASANGKGKSWARITGTVFFGISALALLFVLVTGGGIAKVLEVISFLLGAGTVYLLWAGKGANEYFRARSEA